jgi:uncharacterized protein (TIGR02996 family)
VAILLENPTLLQTVLSVAPLSDAEVSLPFVHSTGVLASSAGDFLQVVRAEVARGVITGPQVSLRVASRLQPTALGQELDPGFRRAQALWAAWKERPPESEAINPELDERLFADFDDERTWAVYADWWLERGDVRGELVRADPQRALRLKELHWRRWFGDLTSYFLTEERGFARALQLPAGSPLDVEALVLRPALRFLETLRVAERFAGSLRALGKLRALAELELVDPSRWTQEQLLAEPLRALETLLVAHLAPHDDDGFALRLDAPRLHALVFTAWEGSLAGTLARLLGWRRLPSLRRVELRGLRLPEARELLSQRHRLGALTGVSADEATLVALRAELRAAFPRATLAPHVPRELSTHWGRAPRHAPADFRTLPARVVLVSRTGEFEDHTKWHGSGEPVGPYEELRRCLACASDQVVCIYGETARTELTSESETCLDNTRELECRACGAFSSYRSFVTR